MRMLIFLGAGALLLLAALSLRRDEGAERTLEERAEKATRTDSDPAEATPQPEPSSSESAFPPPRAGAELRPEIRRLVLALLQRGERQEVAPVADHLAEVLEVTTPLGDAPTRRQVADLAARVLIDELDRARPASGTFRFTPQTSAAIEALSGRLARQLETMLQDPASRHEGTLQLAAVAFEPPEGHRALPWRVLGNFDYYEGEPLPAYVQQLDGDRIAMGGYMLALGSVTALHEFLLVESQWSCCFGEPPALNQVVVCLLPESSGGVDYTAQPVVVAGRLEVGEETEDGFVISVYRLHASSVRPLED